MEKFKITIFSIVVLIILALIGYWAFTTMQSGSEHVSTEKIKQLQIENDDLKKEIENLTYELGVAEAKVEESVAKTEEANTIAEVVKTPTTPTTYKNQTLINELDKLIKDNIYMKLKSNGTRVGTLQKFLNLYNNTKNIVDNDYGPGTVTAVKAFQKAEGLTADGEAGVNTFKKMVEWLKKQG